jgi:hypothetical protein
MQHSDYNILNNRKLSIFGSPTGSVTKETAHPTDGTVSKDELKE